MVANDFNFAIAILVITLCEFLCLRNRAAIIFVIFSAIIVPSDDVILVEVLGFDGKILVENPLYSLFGIFENGLDFPADITSESGVAAT